MLLGEPLEAHKEIQILAKEQDVTPFDIPNVELGHLSCSLPPLPSPSVLP
ncbi:MAG TPA: hypothetical protein VFJ05_06380 [Nitrososphaeraceae archaeon]|nr:hypothetical protein [Nitrososphaeraceae archaeon]